MQFAQTLGGVYGSVEGFFGRLPYQSADLFERVRVLCVSLCNRPKRFQSDAAYLFLVCSEVFTHLLGSVDVGRRVGVWDVGGQETDDGDELCEKHMSVRFLHRWRKTEYVQLIPQCALGAIVRQHLRTRIHPCLAHEGWKCILYHQRRCWDATSA